MRRNLIVIGASAGGVETLQTVVAGLPADLPAAVLVVLHVPPYGGSVLPQILARAGALPARHPHGEEQLADSTIYVAPPDQHLVVRDQLVLATRGPRENGRRPAVDVLFRSAARAAGTRVVGVVLSGVLDDGTAGLAAVGLRGGVTVVQNPSDAMYPGMPTSAIDNVPVDHIVDAKDIAALLVRLCTEELADPHPPASTLRDLGTAPALLADLTMSEPITAGVPSSYSCPDCNGVLFEVREHDIVRYRCRVGHAWSAETLLVEQTQQLEAALWMALRGLEEKAALSSTMHDQAKARQSSVMARRFADQAEETTRAATLIRGLLQRHLGLTPDDEVVGERPPVPDGQHHV